MYYSAHRTYTSAMYARKFSNLDTNNKNDMYVIKPGATNVLFIGGCRSYAYSILFEELCKHNSYLQNAQYGIAVVGVHTLQSINRGKTARLINVFENADIIICEQIRNYHMLNTSKSCEQNIFNNFNIKPHCKIINVPNLECVYEDTPEIKMQNVLRLVEHCKKYNFQKLANYIDENSHIIHLLLITCNHPSTPLFCQLMKELIETNFEVAIDHELMSVMQRVRIFD